MISEKKVGAIYCRKSQAQSGDEESRSVALQMQNALAYAERIGCTVPDDLIFIDDAISGAEIKRLRDRRQLLDMIESGEPPFSLLIMRDSSRFSRRDGDEAFAELKAIAKSGIEIHFYGDGTQFAFGTFATNITGLVRAEVNAEFRRSIATWTSEAMLRKAKAGHVTGGRVFGYDIIAENSHKIRRVNPPEKQVVLRAGELYAGGAGFSAIASALNADGALGPRYRKDPSSKWSAGSVRELINRPLYRGEIIYGRTKKRNVEGEVDPSKRPVSEWIRIDAPELRVFPPELADAIDARLAAVHSRSLHRANGTLLGRPAGEASPYALVGLLRCGICGGSMEVVSRKSGSRRVHAYHCYKARRQGASVCTNKMPVRMADADDAVLDVVEKELMNPKVVERALVLAEAEILRDGTARKREALSADLTRCDKEVEQLIAAIKRGGGDLDSLLVSIRNSEVRRAELRQQIASLEGAARVPKFDVDEVRGKLRSYVADYRKLLRGQVPQMQQILRRLIVGKLTFTPKLNGDYEFAGRGTVRPLLSGVIRNLASQDPPTWNQIADFLRTMQRLRDSAGFAA
jgi:site-specific DNA recombinase